MCEGPFIWYSCTDGGILHCSQCGHITVTGNWNQEDHASTPFLFEGLV